MTPAAPRGVLLPLALAQFICSFAGSNMNVMINDISVDLGTTVQGVQVAITLFLLVMAALMIPGGKLADRYGRKRCFLAGLLVYGVGAVASAIAPGLGVLILGNSILEGIGTALLIPPVYILTTLLFTETVARAKAFGVIMAMGGVGAAAGPLIGGLITTALTWRAAFLFQAVVVLLIALLGRRIEDPLPPDPSAPFDISGAVLSAAGLILIVSGIQAADNDLRLMALLLGLGAVLLTAFVLGIRAKERRGVEPLITTAMFASRTANLGLITQLLQWLLLIGTSFVVATYLQVVRGYNAVQTGVIFTAATAGLLVSSLAAARLARRRSQRTLIRTGFLTSVLGLGVLIALADRSLNPWAFAPGLLLVGLGIGAMLTPSVTVVQSAFGADDQGEISGLSRSASNLGSALGTAVAGTILVADLTGHAYAMATIALAGIGLAGFIVASLLPDQAGDTSRSTR
ncbi:MFS transporter [Nocardia sp. NPDC052001]|uniref:MFS transporter n=1 Tax=Nocardia sp. NPDC052001 TaxID=3154853 RepID=UPI0034400C79